MTVMMPIRALSPEVCLRCPELDIQIDQTVIYDGNLDKVRTQMYCTHYKRCEMILDKLAKEETKEEE